MLEWLKQLQKYNTHNKETNKVDEEFIKMDQEEQKASKEFHKNNEKLYAYQGKEELHTQEAPSLTR